jgi:D-beta-D-heptose 7-phosphate kinase/D-beta-D-heptose 1-phosphate adenosyltransferase
MIPEDLLTANRNKRLRIYVCGDAMLDEYYDVKVPRISPEHPVPVLHSQTEKPITRPGGAANVVYQMRHFNVQPSLFSLLDPLGVEVMLRHDIALDASLCTSPHAKMPVKRRFSDAGIQVCRWDVEPKDYGLSNNLLEGAEAELLRRAQPGADVVILSDYNKGLFRNPQAWINKFSDAITIVDPKRGPIEKWRGCTIFKPNAAEAQELTGLNDWQDQCRHLHKVLECRYVVLTQSGEGVVCFDGDTFFEYRPTDKILLESSIGAGDCFAAFLAMGVGHGLPIQFSVQTAYEAGKLYVQQRLNRPIVPAELSESKIVHPQDLTHRDFSLVFTNGCFDLLHPGHVKLLKEAKAMGDKLLVAINADASVKRLKGDDRPIMDQAARAMLLASMEFVDFVTIFDEDTPYEAIRACCPDVLVKGGDYRPEDVVGSDLVKDVRIVSLVPGRSTTSIIRSLG